jgi:hypothetical protein
MCWPSDKCWRSGGVKGEGTIKLCVDRKGWGAMTRETNMNQSRVHWSTHHFWKCKRCMYTIQVGLCVSTQKDVRADVSCKSHNTGRNLLQSSTCWTLQTSFSQSAPHYLHEMSAHAFLRMVSCEPTCIVYMCTRWTDISNFELALFCLKHNV